MRCLRQGAPGRFARILLRPQGQHLALILLTCWNSGCFAQTITVRIVNLANNKPIKNVPIYVLGLSESSSNEQEEGRRLAVKPIQADLILRTAKNGEARLPIPIPAPAHFYIRALLSATWDCVCIVSIDTEEVLQNGRAVKSGYAGRIERTISPRSGELLVALRPLPWWVRPFAPFAR